MDTGVNVVELYPDLFEGVDHATARRLASIFGSQAHEGWEPNRRDVELLLRHTTGELSAEEYDRIAVAEAHALDDQLTAQRAATQRSA